MSTSVLVFALPYILLLEKRQLFITRFIIFSFYIYYQVLNLKEFFNFLIFFKFFKLISFLILFNYFYYLLNFTSKFH